MIAQQPAECKVLMLERWDVNICTNSNPVVTMGLLFCALIGITNKERERCVQSNNAQAKQTRCIFS